MNLSKYVLKPIAILAIIGAGLAIPSAASAQVTPNSEDVVVEGTVVSTTVAVAEVQQTVPETAAVAAEAAAVAENAAVAGIAFTGADVAGIAAVGLAAIAVGAGLLAARRRVRSA